MTSFHKFWSIIKESHWGKSGIQGHSIGNIFPYRVVIKGSGPGEVLGVAPDGTIVISQPFKKMGNGGDFKDAHKRVEDEIKSLM